MDKLIGYLSLVIGHGHAVALEFVWSQALHPLDHQ
jgi:hypothetical protein